MKKITVASKNPVKISAVLNGFRRVFPQEHFIIEGVEVPSDVSDQPMDDHETLQGARNRAEAARRIVLDADYWAGLEGGVDQLEGTWVAYAWIVVLSGASEGWARTGIFSLPTKVAQLVQEGMELGEADDIVFGTKNSKHAGGAVGLLTGDALTRTELYAEGVILALIPIKNRQLYSDLSC
ncbi:MAG: inosine/xanthosine triphosphatase [Chloroflexota bacterium]